MNPISFITANFVARELGYRLTGGWGQGDAATQAHYRPLETFEERFDAMLADVAKLGFRSVDLWGAMLYPAWATDDHLALARACLERRGLGITSVAAWCGNLEELEGFCRAAAALGADVIAGGAPVLRDHRAEAVKVLERYGVRVAVENHPERAPREVLDLIGDGAGGLIGAAADTGWWATQGYDAALALRELREHLIVVHLKDVLEAGAHRTCRFGLGVAGIEACVRALREIGYDGPLGVEHEPDDRDPAPEVVESKRLLEGWLEAR